MNYVRRSKTILTGLLLAFTFAVPVGAQTISSPDDDSLLKQIIIFGRHSIRSSVASAAQLQDYSRDPYPPFLETYAVTPSPSPEVPEGYLTPRGQQAALLLGSYFRDYLLRERLLSGDSQADLAHSYFRSNSIQRSYVTAAKLGAGLFPDATTISVHCNPLGNDHPDPVIDPIMTGVATVDPIQALTELKGVYGSGEELNAAYSGELSLIRSVLLDYPTEMTPPPPPPLSPPTFADVAAMPFLLGTMPVHTPPMPLFTGSVVSTGALATEFEENVTDATDPWIMQYADGMPLDQVAWGRLSLDQLSQITRLNTLAFDVIMRSPYLARVQSSNAASHVLRSMEQMITGETIPGAFGDVHSQVIVVISSDYYVAGLAGLFGLHWTLPGYQPDFIGPGGALVFELRQLRNTRQYFVRAYFTGQTLDQLRNQTPLTLDAPPATMQLLFPGAAQAATRLDRGDPPYAWESDRMRSSVTGLDVRFKSFQTLVRSAIDPSCVEDPSVEVPPSVLPASEVPLR